MRGHSSITAAVVSFVRGAASVPGSPYRGGRDPVARQLLPAPLRLALRAIEQVPPLLGVLRLASAGLADHVALRTAAIDAALVGALETSPHAQVVLLGAGLDARAYRLTELGAATVFEVDHPATQAEKRRRLGGRPPLAGDVRFVAIDFERESLEDRLAAAGHDPERPTIWIWEGVTLYLQPAAVEATLDVVAARSAPGSTLLMTYLTPDLAERPPVPRPLLRAGFRAIGEPVRATFTADEVKARLASRAFDVVDDGGSEDWARRFLARGRRSIVGISERLVVASRAARAPGR